LWHPVKSERQYPRGEGQRETPRPRCNLSRTLNEQKIIRVYMHCHPISNRPKDFFLADGNGTSDA